MWLLTPIGFFSIVQKPDDTTRNTLTVRARVRQDLESLRLRYLPGLGPRWSPKLLHVWPPKLLHLTGS